MKRLFTLAIIAMIASLTFAQAPLAKKATKKTEVVSIHGVEKKMNEAKAMKAAKAEKAAAVRETSTSVLRRSVKGSAGMVGANSGKVIKGAKLSAKKAEVATKYKAAPQRATTQVGNVTITTDANGIITSVTGVEPKYYSRSNEGTAYFPSNSRMAYDNQTGTATIIEDGDNVYMKDPVSLSGLGTWVKGTKSGNTVTIPAKQPVYYSEDYGATISLRWGLIDADGNGGAADSNADAFTFTIDGDKLILEGTAAWDGTADAYYMGLFWDDDDYNTCYGDAETVLTYNPDYVAPSTELVTVPATAEVADWYMNANQISSSGTKSVKNRAIKVAADELDVYVQGLSANFPESWVKGTLDENTGIVTFPKNQYTGYYEDYQYDTWFLGFDTSLGDICDVTAVYDYDANTITFNEQTVINVTTDYLSYFERYDDVVLSMEEKEFVEPTITDLTAELPYLNGFDTDAEQDEAVVYDANEDGYTFVFDSGAAKYSYSSSNDADDYLVFPGLALKAGVSYKVSVDAKARSSSYSERFEVVVGKEAKASKLSTEVIPATDVESTDFETFKNADFTVEEDGTYYFAVHAISDANNWNLYIDNFSVSDLDPESPVAVDDLSVVADENGANKATVSFTVPTKDLSGNALTGDLNVKVTRDGEEIMNETKAVGAEVSFVDEVEKPGFYVYSVVAADGEHVSEPAALKAYIGEDTPNTVDNLAAVDNGDNTVGLTWDAPTTGKNDGIIIPENLKYNVYPVVMEELWGFQFPDTDYDNPYVTGLTETNATVNFDTNVGDQDYSYFAVTAENEAGESKDKYAVLLTGAPYTLPFNETFTGGLTYFWGGDLDDDNYELDGDVVLGNLSGDENDKEYFLAFDAKTAGWLELYSGKITLSGKAQLSFDMASSAAATLKIIVSAPGKEDVEVKTYDIVASEKFVKQEVSLADFVENPWVRLTFRCEVDNEAMVCLDNISIVVFDNELVAKAISAPTKVEADKEFNVTVTVANEGANAAEGYTVELYKNGEKVAEQVGEAVASTATATVAFAQTLGITEKNAEYKAVIVYDVDENEDNNETETITVTVKLPNYPTVIDLTGEFTGEGVAQLSWNEPNLEAVAPEEITEDFEGAESFALSVDGWTFVDEDGAQIGSIEDVGLGITAASWFVFDNSDESKFNASFEAHSGNKYMSTMYNRDGSQNKDWMISPALCGDAQTISFWTRTYGNYGLEKVEVLYSTTDKELDSFTSLGVQESPTEWTEMTYDLPEGAKYFAIRCVSQDIFMLFVDDVTYIPAEGATADLALVGYNVYRDGVKVNETPVAETSYVDAEATVGEHTYVVTVVYEQGESAPSNEVTIDVTAGISEINAAASANGNVYSVSGAMLRKGNESLNGLAKGVYIINGKKVVVK